jgi:hypothetical protein
MQRARPLLLLAMGASAAVTACAPRLSDDMFRLDGLEPGDRVAIEQDRRRVPTGGTTALVQQPRFVYFQGALVDTNRARWYWIAGGPLAPPLPRSAPAPLPVPPGADQPARPEGVP